MTYQTIIAALEGIVASSSWPTTPKTYTVDFKGVISGNKFIKLEVAFYSSTRAGYSTGSTQITGSVIAQLYYPKSDSRRDIASLVDTLRGLLEDKTLTNLQTGKASLSFLGNDPTNSTLQRADLTVPFTYIGE